MYVYKAISSIHVHSNNNPVYFYINRHGSELLLKCDNLNLLNLPGFPIIAVATLGVAGRCKGDTTLAEETTLVETGVPTLVTTDGTTLVDGTTWVVPDEVTLDMTGKTTLFETDADETTLAATSVTVALVPPLLCC